MKALATDREMKPILFNTDMVRAILNGRKTVTRRAVKPQHLRALDSQYHKEHPETPDKVLLERLCDPPFLPGDILYVREAFAKPYGGVYRYKADCHDHDIVEADIGDVSVSANLILWHPSIHMPREAARIFLRVTDVSVERLQEITEEQAEKEGCTAHGGNLALDEFEEIWHKTIKPANRALYGWEANPYVWVIKFERCEKPEGD